MIPVRQSSIQRHVELEARELSGCKAGVEDDVTAITSPPPLRRRARVEFNKRKIMPQPYTPHDDPAPSASDPMGFGRFNKRKLPITPGLRTSNARTDRRTSTKS